MTFRELLRTRKPYIRIRKKSNGGIEVDAPNVDNTDVLDVSAYAFRDTYNNDVVIECYADYTYALQSMVEFIKQNVQNDTRIYKVNTIRILSRYTFCGLERYVEDIPF